ncbi:hypothetical protein D3C75_1244050 [compost metagenome]
MAAGNALNKSVFIVEGDDFPGTQMVHGHFVEFEFINRFNIKLKGQIQVEIFNCAVPVPWGDLA